MCSADDILTKHTGNLTEDIFAESAPAMPLNTLRLRQNGRQFLNDISKCIFLYENI